MPSEESYNRIFILSGKDGTEDDFRKAFKEFGTISDVYFVKDRRTNESKGIVYITFAKASQAALAIEEMNGQPLPGFSKPMKVLLAADRSEGSVRNDKEDEKLLRIFIVVPKDLSEKDIQEQFEKFGEVDHVKVLMDRDTGKSKGLAFVKYFRSYHAALALEECDPKFRPVFASNKHRSRTRESQDRKSSSRDRYADAMDYEYRPMASGSNYSTGGGGDYGSGSMRQSMASPMDLMGSYTALSPEDSRYLEILASTTCEPEQLHRIFDLIPGLDYCNFDRYTGVASLRYANARCAAYARDKLSGLEYPSGCRLAIHNPQVTGGDFNMSASADFSSGFGASNSTDNVQGNLQMLVDSIQKATSVLQQAGLSTGVPGGQLAGASLAPPVGGGEVRVRYCNVSLPEKKALASRDSPVEMRLFIVSQPEAFPERVLQDAFCRFGGLIDAYFMPGKNFGYAKFAKRECAQAAIDTLHGRHICDMRVKVLEAEAPRNADSDEMYSKRPRI